MDNYKITHPKQIEAILDILIRVYAREVVNTNLLIDVLEKIGDSRQIRDDEITQDLQDISSQIREQIYVEFGYLDPNALK